MISVERRRGPSAEDGHQGESRSDGLVAISDDSLVVPVGISVSDVARYLLDLCGALTPPGVEQCERHLRFDARAVSVKPAGYLRIHRRRIAQQLRESGRLRMQRHCHKRTNQA